MEAELVTPTRTPDLRTQTPVRLSCDFMHLAIMEDAIFYPPPYAAAWSRDTHAARGTLDLAGWQLWPNHVHRSLPAPRSDNTLSHVSRPLLPREGKSSPRPTALYSQWSSPHPFPATQTLVTGAWAPLLALIPEIVHIHLGLQHSTRRRVPPLPPYPTPPFLATQTLATGASVMPTCWPLIPGSRLLQMTATHLPASTPWTVSHSSGTLLAHLGSTYCQRPRRRQSRMSSPANPPANPLPRRAGYNPAAFLSQRVAKMILSLEFVEMSEVALDDDLPGSAGRSAPARPPIQDISQWVERYSLMAGLLDTRFPEKDPEVFAYPAVIVCAECNYQQGQWVVYDRQYRREALAQRDLNWSITDPTLYIEVFTGWARQIPRCQFCLQHDHPEAYCPRNPNRMMFGWFSNPGTWAMPPPTPGPRYSSTDRSDDVCHNQGRYTGKKATKCHRAHSCLTCGGPHPALQCSKQEGPYRSRFPPRALPSSHPRYQ